MWPRKVIGQTTEAPAPDLKKLVAGFGRESRMLPLPWKDTPQMASPNTDEPMKGGSATNQMQNNARLILKIAPLSLLQAVYKSLPEFKAVSSHEPFAGGINNLLAAISSG